MCLTSSVARAKYIVCAGMLGVNLARVEGRIDIYCQKCVDIMLFFLFGVGNGQNPLVNIVCYKVSPCKRAIRQEKHIVQNSKTQCISDQ